MFDSTLYHFSYINHYNIGYYTSYVKLHIERPEIVMYSVPYIIYKLSWRKMGGGGGGI